MARSFWETACQPNPGRFRPHSLPWMGRTRPDAVAGEDDSDVPASWAGPKTPESREIRAADNMGWCRALQGCCNNGRRRP